MIHFLLTCAMLLRRAGTARHGQRHNDVVSVVKARDIEEQGKPVAPDSLIVEWEKAFRGGEVIGMVLGSLW
jgi:hypothetical protein